MALSQDIASQDFLDIWFRSIYQESILLDLNFNNNFTSKCYYIDEVVFQYKVITSKAYESMMILVKFHKNFEGNHIEYEINLFSYDLGIYGKRFNSSCEKWQVLWDGSIKLRPYRFHMFYYQISIVLPPRNSMLYLHDDTELVDFTLKGENGSVLMHRAVLAAHSWKLKKKFSEDWKGCSEGYLEIPDAPIHQATLQHLKDFLYLNKVPKTGWGQLLLVARHYDFHILQKILEYKMARAEIISEDGFEEVLDKAPLHVKNRRQLGNEKMVL